MIHELIASIGITVFADIREDYYTLYSSASKHIGDTRVILATPGDDVETVFLQRTAVTYRSVMTSYKDTFAGVPW